MTSDPLFILVVLSVLLVLAILVFGLSVFMRGGEFNRKHANKIMRARLYAQGLAIVMIMIFIFFRRQGGS